MPTVIPSFTTRPTPSTPAQRVTSILGVLLVGTLPFFTAAACGQASITSETEPDPGDTEPSPEATALVNECQNPQTDWIWCDDFEEDRLDSYFEVDDAEGTFLRRTEVGIDGSSGMRAVYQPSGSQAGNLKLAFGRTPSSYFAPVDEGTRDYRDIYWRMFVRTQPGWTGSGSGKLSRATVLAEDWAQAAIGHVWSEGGGNRLVLDPARGTDPSGNLLTTKYNDFPNLTWLGIGYGDTEIFSEANADRWFCVEAHMRLNDSGESNGVFEFWVDDRLEARQTNLNWLGAYDAYGINAIFFENYWNDGSPVTQERYFDNIVVSTARIGCGG